ncbi:hypothetical protein [Crocinitomix catalasitica]|uniref:hypothetical protein n=1 Tax=Crocinitomix catalasitica TaxID=184607 RepID=UPI000482BC57|nr:hypothetical protein [Crocinitomix catalasitica]
MDNFKMEQEDKILKELIRQEFKEVKAPSNLEHKILQAVQSNIVKKSKPLITPWVWPIIAIFLIVIAILNYTYNLTIDSNFFEFSGLNFDPEIVNYFLVSIKSLISPLLSVAIIALFIIGDFIWRKFKFIKR